jgi:PAS domain-containing protein
VAVTVGQDQYLVLDGDYRIVEVGPAAQATFGPVLGQLAFDAFPDSEPLFRPHYERAARTGEPVEFATFYNGLVLHLRVTPSDSRLVVSWEEIARLDVLTLDGLFESLDMALDALGTSLVEIDRRRRRELLRLVG